MSDTDEPYVEPLTSYVLKPSVESVKADANPPHAAVEMTKLSGDPKPQSAPEPSVDYEKKSL